MPHHVQVAYAAPRDHEPPITTLQLGLAQQLISQTGAEHSNTVSSSARLPTNTSWCVLHASSHNANKLTRSLSDLFNSLADDTYTLSRLGLIGQRIGNKAEKLANWLWFLSTLAGLVEVETESSMVRSLMSDLDERIYDVELDPAKLGRLEKKQNGLVPNGKPNNVDLSVGVEEAGEGLEQLRQQSWTLRITRWKLLMDLIFVCEWKGHLGVVMGLTAFLWQHTRYSALGASESLLWHSLACCPRS